MSHSSVVVTKRALEQFSAAKLLTAYLVPFLAITAFVANGLVNNGSPDDFGSLPVHVQEQFLAGFFLQLSFVWALGVPAMVLVGVLAANGLAIEVDRGTLRILLSKPVRRWQVLLGKFLAIFLFSLLVMVASMLVLATLLVVLSGASPAAVGGAVTGFLPGNLLYAAFASFVVAALGTAAAIATGSRLRTALAVLVVPAVFFGMLFVRILPGTGELYRDNYLYLVDLSYHFGNAFVLFHEAVGPGLSPALQTDLSLLTGAYDTSASGFDPLVGGMASSVPLVGHVPPLVSTLGFLVVAIGLLAATTRRFQRMDVQ